MSKHEKHHSAVEHKAEGSKKEKKILGFELNTILLLAVLVISTAVISTWAGFAIADSIVVQAVPNVNAVDSSLVEIKVENYLNANFTQNLDVTFSLEKINVVGGLVEFNIYAQQGNQKQLAGIAYANEEKMIIANMRAFDLNTPIEQPEVQEPVEVEPVKSDKPQIDLYVMSFCPYGNKAEDTLKPVYELLKNKVDFNVYYIVNVNGTTVDSLHGAPEATQNEREACVLKYYGNQAWFDFATYVNTNCGSTGACWEAGATALKLDKTKIITCVTNEGVDLMKLNETASNLAGASGSPTMKINGVSTTSVYQYGNSDAYKTAICNAFNTAPAECSAMLSASTSTTTGGSC